MTDIGSPAPHRIVCRFSCGAASAVATKLAIAKYGRDRVVITYSDPGSEHPDNRRFLSECERWFGLPITVLKSEVFRDTWDVWEKERFIVSRNGAPCTGLLKREPTYSFYRPDDILVFGYTVEEKKRAESFRRQNFEITLETPLIEAGLSKADCLAMLTRAGIELPVMYGLGYNNNNCFSGDTRFVTDHGLMPLKEMAGRKVRVRGANGGWKDATVASFGIQRLQRLLVRRPGRDREIFVTADHRWFVERPDRRRRIEKTTTALAAGDRLPSIYGYLGSRVRPSAFGIAQGIVFGDGTRGNTLNTASVLVLCGEKNRSLARFFPNSPMAEISAGLQVRDLPRFWKDPPRLDDCQSFLYGWLSGYFAADGNATDDGSYSIASATKEHLEVARDVAIKLGIGTYDIRESERIGLGAKPTILYTLPLIGSTLRSDFFLMGHHRSRFENSSPRKPHPWTVVGVEETDRYEEVFCAVVPDGQAFVIEGNILTGNCLGCPKGGMGYWNKIRVDFPDVFARMAALQRELGPGSGFWRERDTGKRITLDDLAPDRGNHRTEPDVECSLLCHAAEDMFEDDAEVACEGA